MSNLYSINTAQFASDVLPSTKRTTENKSFLVGLLSGFKRKYQSFVDYKNIPTWAAGTYYKYEKVVYNSVYYINNNSTTTGTPGVSADWVALKWSAGTYTIYRQVMYLPTGCIYECVVTSTAGIPSQSSDWVQIVNTFIGVDETQKYDCSFIALTYALNRRFMAVSYADPLVFTPAGDNIYLEIIADGLDMFQVGYIESESSSIDYNTCSEQVTYDDTVSYQNAFNIRVPNILFNTLGSTTEEKKTAVRNFADKYIIAGIYYDVLSY